MLTPPEARPFQEPTSTLTSYERNKFNALLDALPDSLEEIFGESAAFVATRIPFILIPGGAAIEQALLIHSLSSDDFLKLEVNKQCDMASPCVPETSMANLRAKCASIAEKFPNYVNSEAEVEGGKVISNFVYDHEEILEGLKSLGKGIASLTRRSNNENPDIIRLNELQEVIHLKMTAVSVVCERMERDLDIQFTRKAPPSSDAIAELKKIEILKYVMFNAIAVTELLNQKDFLKALCRMESPIDCCHSHEFSHASNAADSGNEAVSAERDAHYGIYQEAVVLWKELIELNLVSDASSRERIQSLKIIDDPRAVRFLDVMSELLYQPEAQAHFEQLPNEARAATDIIRILRRLKREEVMSRSDKGLDSDKELAAEIHKFWPFAFRYCDTKIELSEVMHRMNAIAEASWYSLGCTDALVAHEIFQKHSILIESWLSGYNLLKGSRANFDDLMKRFWETTSFGEMVTS